MSETNDTKPLESTVKVFVIMAKMATVLMLFENDLGSRKDAEAVLKEWRQTMEELGQKE